MRMKAIACYSKDIISRMNSSSGGIFFLLARQVISRNGVVYAAVYTDNFNVEHCRIINEKDIEFAMGAKYAQSHLGNTYANVKSDLENGKNVLFVGTPCQCGGLKSFLNGKDKGMIYVDFICHGVPSHKVLEKYLTEVSKNEKIISLNMRDKTTGWEYYSYSWKYITASGKEAVIKSHKVPYMKGFSSNLFLRPSCYNCCFKGINRLTDLTLADFWGVETQMPRMSDNKGTSLILIHSDLGNEIINSISTYIVAKEADSYSALKRNPSALYSAQYNKKRDIFFGLFDNDENCTNLINDLTKQSTYQRILGKVRKYMNTIKKIRGGGMTTK